ncbi:GNAT family N-acetyltransferase [Mesorhizobium retamae]|uniref:GNAT family N-acetyltransferase n=1 Tax=Mesorhizobium retamae TaxID=2912854 RepID=A0ABS9QNS8_9HYPH|nr:GNAT family N-acetyltransferase [Mesorhizobium sp. IRAMC:0171]MCG7509101.1 GNAT family N-acetyltransferase [Mesorhizobium sp. IRAMC:0171]
MNTEYEVAGACKTDLPAITGLLRANSAARGGGLFGEYDIGKVTCLAFEKGAQAVVAKKQDRVVGVLFSKSPSTDQPAIIEAMLSAYRPAGPFYIYGPVCVAQDQRGAGLLALLYSGIEKFREGEEAVLFIRNDNLASIRAHEKLQMRRASQFQYGGYDYYVYRGAPSSMCDTPRKTR